MDKLDFTKIKWLITDVDGVLTDSTFLMNEDGVISRKFSVHDGYGMIMAKEHGIKIAILTGGKTQDIVKRFNMVGVDEIILGRRDKDKAFLELQKKYDINPSEVVYIGDDLFDLPLLRLVGISVTVANAREQVKKEAKYITKRNGGDGAVREVIDKILGLD